MSHKIAATPITLAKRRCLVRLRDALLSLPDRFCLDSIPYKGKPIERWGRKASGLKTPRESMPAGLPATECTQEVVVNCRPVVADTLPPARYGAPHCKATRAGMQLKIPFAAAISLALMLSACFERKPDDAGGAAANANPVISGSPPTSIRVGESYSFTPSASDPDGDALTFRISNRPSWASFDASTGRLAGTPQDADAGIDANIRISVSDGIVKTALATFSIAVNQMSLGSTTLSWMPPTQNADGSTLTDLTGYRIYYGRGADTMDQVIIINNSGLTRYVIENLSPARWYFSMTSFNSLGVESARSATGSTSIT